MNKRPSFDITVLQSNLHYVLCYKLLLLDHLFLTQNERKFQLAFERLIHQKRGKNEDLEMFGIEYLANGDVRVDGDMMLTKEEFEKSFNVEDKNSFIEKRGGRDGESYYWPEGIVYYELHPSVYKFPGLEENIALAMSEFSEKTCLQFREKTEGVRVLIRASIGRWGYCRRSCYSYIGRIGRETQTLCLGRPKCRTVHGTLLHELGHSLGLYHEQMRQDRDYYATIYSRRADYRVKQNINSRNIPYDFLSVMHYSGKYITAKAGFERYQELMGQRVKLSPKDVELVNLMYRCPINGK